MGRWGKGHAYPLLGDRVRLAKPDKFPHSDIWEVYWFNRVEWTTNTQYTLVPWPSLDYSGRIVVYRHQLLPVDRLETVLTDIITAVERDDGTG